MTKDSRALSLEMDADSQGGTPHGSSAVSAAPRSARHSSEGALSQSDRHAALHNTMQHDSYLD